MFIYRNWKHSKYIVQLDSVRNVWLYQHNVFMFFLHFNTPVIFFLIITNVQNQNNMQKGLIEYMNWWTNFQTNNVRSVLNTNDFYIKYWLNAFYAKNTNLLAVLVHPPIKITCSDHVIFKVARAILGKCFEW